MDITTDLFATATVTTDPQTGAEVVVLDGVAYSPVEAFAILDAACDAARRIRAERESNPSEVAEQVMATRNGVTWWPVHRTDSGSVYHPDGQQMLAPVEVLTYAEYDARFPAEG